jgi:hypothetical protein
LTRPLFKFRNIGLKKLQVMSGCGFLNAVQERLTEAVRLLWRHYREIFLHEFELEDGVLVVGRLLHAMPWLCGKRPEFFLSMGCDVKLNCPHPTHNAGAEDAPKLGAQERIMQKRRKASGMCGLRAGRW